MESERPHGVKLAQVALAAGVSKTTASTALQGSGRISSETRKHVLEIAHQLGYRPNAGARALRLGSEPILGVVMRNRMTLVPGPLQAMFWPRLMFSMIEELTAAGIGVLTVSDVEGGPLNRLPMDAVLTVAADPNTDEVVASLPAGIPRIIGGIPDPIPGVTTVGHDHGLLTRDALDHLEENGARRPAILLGTTVTPIVRLPLMAAYKQWCAQRGIAPRIIQIGIDDEIGPPAAAAIREGTDAIYSVTGDNLAVLFALTDSEVKVPEDVLLIGLGEGPLGTALRPRVSTVTMQGAKSGHIVAGIVVKLLATGKDVHAQLPHKIIARASSSRSQ